MHICSISSSRTLGKKKKKVGNCGCDCNVHCFTIRFRCEKHYMRTLMTDKHMNRVLIPGGSLRKYLAHSAHIKQIHDK